MYLLIFYEIVKFLKLLTVINPDLVCNLVPLKVATQFASVLKSAIAFLNFLSCRLEKV